MIALAVIGFSSACILSPQPDPPGILDGGAEAGSGDVSRDGTEGGEWADVGADGGPPPEDAVDEEGDGTSLDDECPTDPADGPTGNACDDDSDCGAGFVCMPEYAAADGEGNPFMDYPGGYCLPRLPEGTTCAAGDPTSCPEGARCVEAAAAGVGDGPRCLDACSAVSVEGALYGANCDCRPGYRCDPSLEVCVPGCTADHECCVEWTDGNGDGVRQVEELTRLAECVGRCDPHTFECVYAGAPGSGVGDPCTHGSQCPAGSRCWRSAAALREGRPGFCVFERCDLPGRACAEGAACVLEDPGFGLTAFCARICDPGAAPGTPGDTCAETTVCTPVGLVSPSTATGVCLPPG